MTERGRNHVVHLAEDTAEKKRALLRNMGRHMVKFDAPDYAGCDTQCTRYLIRGAMALRAYLICGVIAACDTCLCVVGAYVFADISATFF